MGSDELIERIKKRSNDPKRRTSGSRFDLERFKSDPRWQRAYPPVTSEQVKETEALLGFQLPRLLTRLYVEVANGGFGPGVTSCIDCAPSQGRMVFSVDPVTNIPEGMTFDQWMEDWVKGVNLRRGRCGEQKY
jgi:hypothetical protein